MTSNPSTFGVLESNEGGGCSTVLQLDFVRFFPQFSVVK